MLEKLKERVCEQNLQLVKYGLVVLTWGNVSALSEDGKYVVIKPSGVSYDNMKAEDMVVTDRAGHIVEGGLRPSTDLATHLALYDAFPGIGGAVHTHSRYAVAAAQAGAGSPLLRHDPRRLLLRRRPLCPGAYGGGDRGSLRAQHRPRHRRDVPRSGHRSAGSSGGAREEPRPFTWGKTPEKAVENALVLDECAHMALLTRLFDPSAAPAAQCIQDKHYFRKHGANAYYGQK